MAVATHSPTSVIHWLRQHSIIGGAAIGLVWGASMRVWMRFISAHPEFSWPGTLFIVGASTIVGAVLGAAWWRRRVGGAGWWRLSALSLILLGAGGAVMWPSVVLGAIGIGQWRYRLARLLVAAAVLVQVPVLRQVFDDNWRMSGVAMTLAVLWYVPMLALEAWGFSVAYAPALKQPAQPARGGRVRKVVVAVGLVGVSGLGLVVIGAAG